MGKVVADGEQTVGTSGAPETRAHPERQDERADAGRAIPPPGREAVRIGVAGGADRRSGADVCGKERREDGGGRQAASCNEEVGASSDAPRDPEPDSDLCETPDGEDAG